MGSAEECAPPGGRADAPVPGRAAASSGLDDKCFGYSCPWSPFEISVPAAQICPRNSSSCV
jgi:hypothetical protein